MFNKKKCSHLFTLQAPYLGCSVENFLKNNLWEKSDFPKLYCFVFLDFGALWAGMQVLQCICAAMIILTFNNTCELMPQWAKMRKNPISNMCLGGCTIHSSEIRGLCLMKSSSERLQNLPYFIYMRTRSCFSIFYFMLF